MILSILTTGSITIFMIISCICLGRFFGNGAPYIAYGFPSMFLIITSLGYFLNGPSLAIVFWLFILALLFIGVREIKFLKIEFLAAPIIAPLVMLISLIPTLTKGEFLFFSEGIGDITIFAPTAYVIDSPLSRGLSLSSSDEPLMKIDLESVSANERLILLGWTQKYPGWFSLSHLYRNLGLTVEISWFVGIVSLISIMLIALFATLNHLNQIQKTKFKKWQLYLVTLIPTVMYGSYIAGNNGSFAQLQSQAICSCYIAAILSSKFLLSNSWHAVFILASVVSYYPSSYIPALLLSASILIRWKARVRYE